MSIRIHPIGGPKQAPRGGLSLATAVLVLVTTAGSPAAAAAAGKARPSADQVPAPRTSQAPKAAAPDRDLTLRGGEEITAFGNLTVEGEDQIHFDFDRPALDLALDAAQAPGLDMGSPLEVLKRTAPNRTHPFLALSARERSPYVARPWLHAFASGAVAVFKPAVRDVDRWQFSIVDSRGEVVAKFDGRGEPHEIVWDGRLNRGGYAVPGRVYSSVLQAHDRAGNKRSLVGEGFEVGPFRHDLASGPVFLFPAGALGDPASATGSAPGLLLEAASWINQAGRTQPIRVFGIARTQEGASAVASRVAAGLGPWVIGGAGRIQTGVEVEPDAPPAGTVRIAVGNVLGAVGPNGRPAAR